MQQKDINIFLDLVRTRNITKTSEDLHISQSAISTHLKHLEEEIGYPLFIRSKGQRSIKLTRQGLNFIAIAERWLNLFEETKILQLNMQYSIQVACNEGNYYSFLQPFMKQFFLRHPDCHISLEICDSHITYDLMEHNLIDYGFVAYESYRSGVRCSLVKADEARIICSRHAGIPYHINPSDLAPEKEIRFTGGNFATVDKWRKALFGTTPSCRLETNNVLSVADFIRDSDYWAVCPETFANQVAAKEGLQVSELPAGSLHWQMYLLTREMPQKEKLTINKLFEEELKEYIQKI